jgi:hypothetical protein
MESSSPSAGVAKLYVMDFDWKIVNLLLRDSKEDSNDDCKDD